MSRAFLVFAALSLSVVGWVPAFGEEVTLTLGKSFEGVLEAAAHKRVGNIDDFRNSIGGYATEMFIQLKSKEPLVVTAEVVGDDRQVAILVEDPAGGRVTFQYFAKGQATAKVKMLNITGQYKITIVSDKVGDYSVKATNPNLLSDRSGGGRKALEAKIERLKAELKQAQEDLKLLPNEKD